MNKLASLFRSIENFAFISEASLRSDMAKRIMYSLIPSLTDQTQIYHTGGVVDYKALAAAIEGRHDIIKYASRACVKELEYYHGTHHNIKSQAKEALHKKDYGNCLDICIKGFADSKGWDISFGGEPWKKIATTAKNLQILDENLMELRTRPKPPEDFYEQEAEIMKQIIIQLNIFDGLAHNTASIMNNMTNEEAIELDNPIKSYENMEAIQKLMDAKEVTDPTAVFKMIEKELIDSGDIHRYKDWTKKLRTQKTYKEEDPNLSREKFLIRFRKEILNERINLNTRREKLEEGQREVPNLNHLDAVRNEVNNNLYLLGYSLDNINRSVDHTTRVLEKYNVPNTYFDMAKHIKNTVKKFKDKRDRLYREVQDLNILSWHEGDEQTKKNNLSYFYKIVISLYNDISMYLDSI